MPASETEARWDAEYDVVVVGSGAGGMTAALCAQGRGLQALVVEKDRVYGGTSAVSGGGIWVPCNDQMADAGVPDSREEALTYLRHLTEGEVPESRLAAYVDGAREMVREMGERFGVRFRAVAKYPDYFPDRPGGKPGARTMEPEAVDARALGETFFDQREPYKGTLVLGRISMDQVEAHRLFSRARGWIGLTIRLMWRYWTDLRWRRRTWRDRRLVLGQGLVAALRQAMLERAVPLQLDTALEELVEDQGRVSGVVVRQQGALRRIRARHGVVLAAGGFESSQAMREAHLPQPTKAEWSAAPGMNTGDAIRAGQALGAELGFMHRVWGAPTVMVPGSAIATALFVERSLPGCVIVNAAGQRFFNEAAPYTEAVEAIYANHRDTGGAIPCWMIVDGRFRKNYPLGPMLPGSMQPDKKLPKNWLGTVYYKADSIDALAGQIGVDSSGLQATVSRMAQFAERGEDADFGKGNNVFDRYYADPRVQPNPCLAPLAQPPFYALPLYPGEIGTKGGLVTDERARVLRTDGSVIAGLYAVGNCSAAVMGKTYAGPGATLGPAMTFAWLAAQDLAAGESEEAARAVA